MDSDAGFFPKCGQGQKISFRFIFPLGLLFEGSAREFFALATRVLDSGGLRDPIIPC